MITELVNHALVGTQPARLSAPHALEVETLPAQVIHQPTFASSSSNVAANSRPSSRPPTPFSVVRNCAATEAT
jgi:hypothetical protein